MEEIKFPAVKLGLYVLLEKKHVAWMKSLADSFLHSPIWIVVSVAQSCPTLCDPMDYSPPGSSVQGIFPKRILEWVAVSFARAFSLSRD